jgi:hypothetical protein
MGIECNGNLLFPMENITAVSCAYVPLDLCVLKFKTAGKMPELLKNSHWKHAHYTA